MMLFIDNYDSFTYNLVQYFRELGATVRVVRNDELTLDDMQSLDIEALVISPGPCDPDRAGTSMAAIAYYAGKVPILGVCLGHQCIGQVYGGRIVRAPEIVHGKVSVITHHGCDLFADIPSPLDVVRYHSLAIDPLTVPMCLEVTSTSADGTIMAIRHRELPIWGVQFHPESILTEAGKELIGNFLQLASTWNASRVANSGGTV